MPSSEAPKFDRHARQRDAYRFLFEHAQSGHDFTKDELRHATGWSDESVRTYISKHYREYLTRVGKSYRVRPEFSRISVEDVVKLAAQNRTIYSSYQRVRYGYVICYEFLLPLTRAEQLREALDALFYRDTLGQRILEIGIENLQAIIPRQAGWSEEQYLAEILGIVAKRFSGYSMSQVSGRFRAGELVTRKAAGALLAGGKRYLVDEATAVVRFIVPCQSSRNEYGADFESMARAINHDSFNADELAAMTEELRMIRLLFFHLFVETVVRTVDGEDEIWLLETGPEQHLYVWERSPR